MFQSFQTPAYAGFWLRFAAYLIDTIILGLIFVPLGAILGVLLLATGNEPDPSLTLALDGGIRVGSIIVGWLYSSLLESSSWQGTVGKKVCGLRVTDLDGHQITFGKATGRYFGKILSSLICLVGFFMVAFTEKHQGLHDQLAGTLVVTGAASSGSYPEPPPPPDFSYRGGGPIGQG